MSSELKYRVSLTAKNYYNPSKERVDWEGVSNELRMPIPKALEYFDESICGIRQRSISESQDWGIETLTALKSFTETYFQHCMSVEDWILVGKYMNICHSDCVAKMWALGKFRMTPILFEQITEYRDAGLLWPTICRNTADCTPDILRIAYATSNKETLYQSKRPKAKFRISKHQHWSREEDARLVELLSQYGNGNDVDWNYISKTLGHSKNACRYRRILLRPQIQGARGSSIDTDHGASSSDSPSLGIEYLLN
ncbi:hypothetical protein GGI01_002441 [Coemansia sp. RSA 376]|nr:hypothetical protein H4S04_005558 [Coemansia sp. S16]KAJ2063604.1 hypothetical protein GGH13_006272 [Coemansia sp. S155-1]KAJ2261227.1 hypothetical protein GGI01_002441 [Coemansia sp. RSA 376]